MSLPVSGRRPNGEFNQIVCNNIVTSTSSGFTPVGTEYLLDGDSATTSGIRPSVPTDAGAGSPLSLVTQSSSGAAGGELSLTAGSNTASGNAGGVIARGGNAVVGIAGGVAVIGGQTTSSGKAGSVYLIGGTTAGTSGLSSSNVYLIPGYNTAAGDEGEGNFSAQTSGQVVVDVRSQSVNAAAHMVFQQTSMPSPIVDVESSIAAYSSDTAGRISCNGATSASITFRTSYYVPPFVNISTNGATAGAVINTAVAESGFTVSSVGGTFDGFTWTCIAGSYETPE